MQRLQLQYVILFFLCLWAMPANALENFVKDRLTIATPTGQHDFEVEIANTPAKLKQGLMHRMSLEPNHGMLLVFSSPSKHELWMKNTYIPLDMVFVDTMGRVLGVYNNAIPLTLKRIPTPPKTKAVLELNAGTLKERSIVPGSQILHPIFRF